MSMQKIAILVLCINMFLYLGIGQVYNQDEKTHLVRIQGDLFDYLLEDKGAFEQNMNQYEDSIRSGKNITLGTSLNISSGLIQFEKNQAQGVSADTGLLGFSLLDALGILWAFLMTLLNMVLTPITLFSVANFPPIIALMFGVPLSFMFLLAWVILLRGGGG